MRGKAAFDWIGAAVMAVALHAALLLRIPAPPVSDASEVGLGGVTVAVTMTSAMMGADQDRAGEEKSKIEDRAPSPPPEEAPPEEVPPEEVPLKEALLEDTPPEEVPPEQLLSEELPSQEALLEEDLRADGVPTEPPPKWVEPKLDAEDAKPVSLVEPEPVEMVSMEPPPEREITEHVLTPAPRLPPKIDRPKIDRVIEALVQPAQLPVAPQLPVAELPAAKLPARLVNPIATEDKAPTDRAEPVLASKASTGIKEEAETGEAPDQINVLGGNPIAGPPSDYITMIKHWLERYKKYPRRARKKRQQGVVQVAIRINRKGVIQQQMIRKSSGYRLLDEEIHRMLKRAQPLPPFPASMDNIYLDIVVPIEFSLR